MTWDWTDAAFMSAAMVVVLWLAIDAMRDVRCWRKHRDYRRGLMRGVVQGWRRRP